MEQRSLLYKSYLKAAQLHLKAGRAMEAGAACAAAIKLVPSVGGAYRLLGHALIKLNRHDDAITALGHAVRIDPTCAESLCALAVASSGTGRIDEAEAYYRQAISVKPDFELAYINLGTLLANHGRYRDAESVARGYLLRRPDSAQAQNAVGAILAKQKRYEEATQFFIGALKSQPDAPALSNLGCALLHQGRLGEAVEKFQQSLLLRPGNAEAYSNLGMALARLKRWREAEVCCREALRLKPGYPAAFTNLGTVYKECGRLAESEACFRDAIRQQPRSAEAYSNLGTTLFDRGLFADAEQCYMRALQYQPDLDSARFNLGILCLLQGRLAEGWPLYESRWETFPLCLQKREFSQPQWRGDFDLEGKTILLHAEQGLGDTIQFCRYILAVKAKGAKVLLLIPPALHRLLGALGGVDEFGDTVESMGSFDCHCPLLSLPLSFGTTIETIPLPMPYLAAEPARRAEFERLLGPSVSPRIGLVWRGSPNHKGDRQRSIALSAIIHVLPKGPQYVALQKEVSDAERTILATRNDIWIAENELGDLADTAALASCLDVITSVDTSVCHLAAALGRPTWILLPLVADWRWLQERADSPWYESVRLFRQETLGDWSAPLARLNTALLATCQSRS